MRTHLTVSVKLNSRLVESDAMGQKLDNGLRRHRIRSAEFGADECFPSDGSIPKQRPCDDLRVSIFHSRVGELSDIPCSSKKEYERGNQVRTNR